MGWHYKSPQKFPALYPLALRSAAASYPQSFNLGAYHTLRAAKAEAENFRWYRWCLRKYPDIEASLSQIELGSSARATISEILGGYSLDLIVSPPRISSLLALNPELALLECQ